MIKIVTKKLKKTLCEKAGEKEEEDKTFYLSTLNKDKDKTM